MNRRDFIKQAILWIGGLITASLGFLGGGYFLSPLWKKRKEDWIDIGPVGDIKKGKPVKLEFVQRKRDGWVMEESRASTWVITPDGKNFTSYDPHCTHLGCPFRWDDDKDVFLCPCHNGIFSANGEPVSGPIPRPLDRYPTKVVGGKLFIKPIPQQAHV